MRSALPSAVTVAALAVFVMPACSKPPAPAAAVAEPADATAPAPQVDVPMAIAHGPDVVPQHGVPAAGDRTMPSEPIAQPDGGTSIAEVWANRQALAGRQVTVRGKVVKFHAAIMNRNWLHLQDGTGKPADGTHDLTFTTADTARIGDIVTATGTVAIDRDFTAGYEYGVIVEGASLK